MPLLGSELIWIIAALLIVGVILWGLNQIPGIDPTIKAIVRVVIIVFLAIWLIYLFAGLATGLPALPGRR